MDQNPPITNYKPWPFELFEMNIYCLRGLLSWGDKSGRLSKNHGSLAGGISISCGLHCSWWLCHQISLDYYTIPPATQATNQQTNLCHTFSDDVLLFAFLRFSGVEGWDSHRQHTDAWQYTQQQLLTTQINHFRGPHPPGEQRPRSTIQCVKPLLSGHLRDLPKCLLNRGCKNCAILSTIKTQRLLCTVIKFYVVKEAIQSSSSLPSLICV